MRSSKVKHLQKTGKIPKHCPNCKSQRLELYNKTKNGLTKKGWYCQGCHFISARRLTNKVFNVSLEFDSYR